MAARPSWHLRLSLVTCPVALYPATSEADTVRFNLINLQTNNRIKMKTVDAGTGEEVSRSDLVKGFAVAKNQYVLVDKEDFESVKLAMHGAVSTLCNGTYCPRRQSFDVRLMSLRQGTASRARMLTMPSRAMQTTC
jgi:hypothetical protein